jgi:hypothetical protein
VDFFQQWQKKGCRFARARICQTNQIMTVQNRFDRLILDRSRNLIAFVPKVLFYFRRQIKIIKSVPNDNFFKSIIVLTGSFFNKSIDIDDWFFVSAGPGPKRAMTRSTSKITLSSFSKPTRASGVLHVSRFLAHSVR